MPVRPRHVLPLGLILFIGALICLARIAPASAEEKSIYSPIIQIDKEKGWLVVSSNGAVFAVEASAAAKQHLDKLPASGMIDIVVETRPDGPPILKSWKLAAGESSCKTFDGKTCK
jgi:hypothetical protein